MEWTTPTRRPTFPHSAPLSPTVKSTPCLSRDRLFTYSHHRPDYCGGFLQGSSDALTGTRQRNPSPPPGHADAVLPRRESMARPVLPRFRATSRQQRGLRSAIPPKDDARRAANGDRGFGPPAPRLAFASPAPTPDLAPPGRTPSAATAPGQCPRFPTDAPTARQNRCIHEGTGSPPPRETQPSRTGQGRRAVGNLAPPSPTRASEPEATGTGRAQP